jgi:type IV secretion system protein VirD4
VVAWLAGEQPGERYEDYFKHAARALLACLLADILFAPGLLPEEKTLTLLRKRVAVPIPELRQLLEDIYAKGDSYGFGFPAQLAGNLKDITEKQFSGFYGEAGNLTAWLACHHWRGWFAGHPSRHETFSRGRWTSSSTFR